MSHKAKEEAARDILTNSRPITHNYEYFTETIENVILSNHKINVSTLLLSEIKHS